MKLLAALLLTTLSLVPCLWPAAAEHSEAGALPSAAKPPLNVLFIISDDLCPTVTALCGLERQDRLQGRDVSPMLDDPAHELRSAAFSVNGKGYLLRERDWAYIQYGEDASQGIELFDMRSDPKQYTNLAGNADHADTVARFRKQMTEKLSAVRSNDLGIDYTTRERK